MEPTIRSFTLTPALIPWCELPVFGAIREIEVKPAVEAMNTDASRPYRLYIELVAATGERVPLDVRLHCSMIPR